MLKKRFIGVVTVKDGWAVQSFGYRRYLPLGRPEVLVQNLDRWGADEILVQCIDRSTFKIGPDFDLLKKLGDIGLSTPLTYGGGICDAEEAVESVALGADRVLLDAMIWDNSGELETLSRTLGAQALVAHMPVRIHNRNLIWRNYRTGNEIPLTQDVFSRINLEWVSEVMLTDWQHDGVRSGFDRDIPKLFPLKNMPLLLFGGLSDASLIEDVLVCPNVVGIGVGNFLNYREHAIQLIKRGIVCAPIRAPQFTTEEY